MDAKKLLKRRMNVMLAVLALALPFMGLACDGESGTSGPANQNMAGLTCLEDSDCGGLSCLNLDGDNTCTPTCEKDADCPDSLPCCGTDISACVPEILCDEFNTGVAADEDQSADGDASTEDDNSTDEPVNANCEFDTYKCGESTETYGKVLRCAKTAIGTEWQVARTCEECCIEGQCITGDDCAAVDPPPDGICTPNTYRCRTWSEVQVCSSDGKAWNFYKECSELGKFCVDAACVEEPPADNDGEQEEEFDPRVECSMEAGCQLSEDEYCFNTDPDATTGRCWVRCNIDGGDRCPRSHECNLENGECEPIPSYCTSDMDCSTDEFCDMLGGSTSDGYCTRYCFKLGASCALRTKCDTDPHSLNYGKCIPDEDCKSCDYDGMCDADSYCYVPPGQVTGCCMLRCTDKDGDCEAHEVCCYGSLVCGDDGKCTKGNGSCNCGGVCPQGYICDQMFCQCVLNCPPCPLDTCCDATSAPQCTITGPACPECINPAVCGIALKQCCPGSNCSVFAWAYGLVGFCA